MGLLATVTGNVVLTDGFAATTDVVVAGFARVATGFTVTFAVEFVIEVANFAGAAINSSDIPTITKPVRTIRFFISNSF
jgi:hypothetical protein